MNPSRELYVGLAQFRPVLGDMAANIATIEATLAAHDSVDIMVWPELYLCGYTTTDIERLAVALDGPEVEALCALAQRFDCALVVGLAERCENGIANSALAIDRDGRIAGCYRKTQLFGAEADAFIAGDTLVVARLAGVACGLMICFDIEFPEVARTLAAGGAELLVSVSANMTPFAPDHRLCVQARALENRRCHVYVNQMGQGETFWFTGDSAVADTAGQITAEQGAESQGCRVVAIDLAAETEIRPDYLAQRRGPLTVISS